MTATPTSFIPSFKPTVISPPYLERALRRGVFRYIGYPAAVDADDGIRHVRDVRVVRDHDRGEPALRSKPREPIEHAAPRLFVERARRLVEEHYLRLFCHGARYANALLLAARQLRRSFCELVFKPDRLRDRRYVRLAGERRAELDILLDGQMRQQIILLKHEPDLFPSELGKLFVCHRCKLEAAAIDSARIGTLEPRKNGQQRGLAGARRAEYDDEPAVVDIQRNAVEHGRKSAVVRFFDIPCSYTHDAPPVIGF